MSSEPTIIRKSALAVFKDKKMLMTREEGNEFAFYMLGGTMEPGESEIDCLYREVAEEVSANIVEGSLEYLAEFENVAHGRENTRVNIKLYQGELDAEPRPANEVVEVKYFDSSMDQKYLTPVSVEIFNWLKERDYIN